MQAEVEEENGARLGIDLTLCPQDLLPEATNKRLRFTARIYTFNEADENWEYKGEAGEKKRDHVRIRARMYIEDLHRHIHREVINRSLRT
jgi:hypothetical protein